MLTQGYHQYADDCRRIQFETLDEQKCLTGIREGKTDSVKSVVESAKATYEVQIRKHVLLEQEKDAWVKREADRLPVEVWV